MMVEATFFNPYPISKGSWSYGFLLRNSSFGYYHQIRVRSKGAWRHSLRLGNEFFGDLQSQRSDSVDVTPEGKNQLQVITIGDEGWVYINGVFEGNINLGGLPEPFDNFVVLGNETEGEATRFEGFTIWKWHPSLATLPEIIHFGNAKQGWNKIPTVVVYAAEGDPRVELVREAIDYWNGLLADMGSPFKLGPVVHEEVIVPAEYLQGVSAGVLERKAYPDLPETLKKVPGDLVIALSTVEFISFSSSRPLPDGKVLIGMRSNQIRPLNLPNVERNVIAHELGHAIGLGHNDAGTKLMCGRPASCRPAIFQSLEERFFPITEQEKATLLQFYPPTWKPTQ